MLPTARVVGKIPHCCLTFCGFSFEHHVSKWALVMYPGWLEIYYIVKNANTSVGDREQYFHRASCGTAGRINASYLRVNSMLKANILYIYICIYKCIYTYIQLFIFWLLKKVFSPSKHSLLQQQNTFYSVKSSEKNQLSNYLAEQEHCQPRASRWDHCPLLVHAAFPWGGTSKPSWAAVVQEELSGQSGKLTHDCFPECRDAAFLFSPVVPHCPSENPTETCSACLQIQEHGISIGTCMPACDLHSQA